MSVVSWQSVLFVEETEVPGENHGSVASHLQTLSHNIVLVHIVWMGFDCIGTCSCKSNYHTISAMTAPDIL